MLKLFRPFQGHKDIWEGGGVAPPINFITRQAECLISRPARSIPSQSKPVPLGFTVGLCIYCHSGVNL